MAIDDRLKDAVRDVQADPEAFAGIEQGIVRHHRRVVVARVVTAVTVLAIAAGALALAIDAFQGPGPKVTPIGHPRRSHLPSPVGLVTNFQPQAVVFFDSGNGLTGGSDGACDTNCKGVIERSTDGGSTWQPVWTGDGIVDDLTALGPNEAWATIDRCRNSGVQGCSNLILHSGDAGTTWTELATAPVSGLTFATPHIGWAISSQGPGAPASTPLATTVDGGRTWTTVADPCPAGAPFPTSIRFASVDLGWLACEGEGATIMSAKAILKTTDSGVTWAPQSEVFAPGAGPTVPVGGLSIDGHQPGLAFLPDGHGWMWLSRDCLYGTVDGGADWTKLGGCRPDIDYVTSAWLIDDLHGFEMVRVSDARRLELRATDDGGATFHVVASWPLA
jgi:photosystem II stability/assembly factor-like uncharacterized protein